MNRQVCVGLALIAWLVMRTAPGVGAVPPAQTGIPITYGETISGEITENEPCVIYWFEGTAGDSVQIDMSRTGGSLDGVLSLYMRDGAEPVATNDDRPEGGLDPLIEATLPETDWYTVEACRLEHEEMRVTTGTFDLTLIRLESPSEPAAAEAAPPDEPQIAETPIPSLTDGVFPPSESSPDTGEPASSTSEATPGAGGAIQGTGGHSVESDSGANAESLAPDAQPITYGDTVAGRLEIGEASISFQVDASAGDRVMVEWQRKSGPLRPQIDVYDAAGELIAQAGASSRATDLWLMCTAPADGALIITLSRSDRAIEDTAGGFDLTVTLAAE